jgi:ribosome-associated protein
MRPRRSWRTRTRPDIAKNAVGAAHVRIQADRNTVTLSGRVDTRAERQARADFEHDKRPRGPRQERQGAGAGKVGERGGGTAHPSRRCPPPGSSRHFHATRIWHAWCKISTISAMIQITDVIVLDEHEITERFVRASGPGGQNVNKEATAVELRMDISQSSLPSDLKKRLRALAGRHVTTGDVLVVVGRTRRSQARNRVAARAELVALLKRAARSPKARKATRPGPSTRAAQVASKQRRSALKRARKGGGED